MFDMNECKWNKESWRKEKNGREKIKKKIKLINIEIMFK